MQSRKCLAIPVLALSLALPEFAKADLSERQTRLLAANCMQCHARVNVGVPLIGNPDDWEKRNAQGEETMLRNAIQGMRGMPPLGYCAACTEEDLRALVRWLSGLDGGS
ncbi:cytochrome c5 family protein [Bradyrhizobium manausense]|uniref:c-type cytochrome n=1 Tax=Bradyrhizobium manausense TaxID=989370 RepID=UPI001BACB8A1|nr:c-type cytochrome [Bradyrhizobium manausense]MBR0834269.1 cytochrome c5 family protein [Bradyrhizobium manausense]